MCVVAAVIGSSISSTSASVGVILETRLVSTSLFLATSRLEKSEKQRKTGMDKPRPLTGSCGLGYALLHVNGYILRIDAKHTLFPCVPAQNCTKL